MKQLTRADLAPLETYAEMRPAFRAEVIAHKRNRHIALGEHVRLLFEDCMTIQYQVQEMLRTERIFEAVAIQEELDAYNPLVPDGENLKATMLIEYEDVAERQLELKKLKDIEHHIYAQIGEHKIYAIADEDLERSNDEKTASVHFLRFQFDDGLVGLLRGGEDLSFGCDHKNYRETAEASAAQRRALLLDFE